MALRLKSSRGVALVIALTAAIVVSLTAWGVLNLTWQRFQASAVRTDRLVALAAAEAGLRYILTRLDLDPDRDGDGNGVPDLQDAVANDYVIACHPNPNALAPQETVDGLHMGGSTAPTEPNPGKHVTIRLRFLTAPPYPGRPYDVRVLADFSEG